MANQERGPLQAKRGSAADWAATAVPLLSAEWGYDETNGIAKIGNGSTLWGDLPNPQSGLSYDPTTQAFSVGSARNIPSMDPTTLQFSEATRAANSVLTPVWKFGAKGDGVTDDTAALRAAIASGVALYWGGPDRVYRITSSIVLQLQAPVAWYSSMVWVSDGAAIVVDSAAPIQRAMSIDTNGQTVVINGTLSIDGKMKAFTGWYFWTASTVRANFTAIRLGVRNIYRASTAFTGGDGIWVSGGYDNVYLERPDVRDIVMATGAGISGSQGVAGITVKSQGPGLAPTEITILHPWVQNVYSEDSTYGMDQDGLRLFTEEDNGDVQLFDTHFSVIGGTFKNCRGRSIKSQCEFGRIDGTKFIRDSTQLAAIAGVGIMPEIDFQVGGGIVTDIELRYRSASPDRIIQSSGTRQAGGKYSTGPKVDGVKISRAGSGTARPVCFMQIQLFEQLLYIADIMNVQYIDNGNAINGDFVRLTGDYTTAVAHVRLTNIAAPIATGQSLFRRTSTVAVPTYVSIINAVNYRSPGASPAPALSSSSVTGSLTVSSASGQQVGFA